MTVLEHPLSPEVLMEYLDGELSAERAAMVEAHVIGCAQCLRLRGELGGVSRDVRRWEIEEPPATLKAPEPSRADGADRRRGFFEWMRARPSLAYSAAALAVVLVGGVVSDRLSGRRTPVDVVAMRGPAPERFVSESAAPAIPADRPEIAQELSRLPAAPESPAVAEGALVVGRASAPQAAPGPSIARVARLRIRTTSFDAARPVVDRVVTETGGLVGTVGVSGGRGGARSLTATLLIPAASLDAALLSLRAIGHVVDESQSGENVTEQIIDVESRLSNARNTERRLIELLQKRTGDLADVIAAEREIARIREEIERFVARRTNLARRVTYASLTLEVAEEREAEIDLGPQPLSGMFHDASVTGISLAIDSALGVSLLVVRVAPVLLLWTALLAWPAWIAAKKTRRRKPLNP